MLNLTTPAQSGSDLVQSLARNHPNVRTIVLMLEPTPRLLRELLAAGAHACMTRECSATELVDAIRAVTSGKTHLKQRLVDLMVSGYARPAAPDKPELAPREREILQRIAGGESTKEIARALGVAFDRVVAEFQPYAARGTGVAGALHLAWTDWGLLPLVLFVAQALPLVVKKQPANSRRAAAEENVDRPDDVTLRCLLLCVSMYLVLTLYQTRWSGYFPTVLIVTAACALRRGLPQRPVSCAVVMAVAMLPVAWRWMQVAANVRSIGGDARQGPFLDTLALEAASQAIARAHPDRPPAVLAPWSHGGTLAGMGKSQPVGSQYWSNLDGLMETFGLFVETSDARFIERCDARNVRYFVLPDPDELVGVIVESFVAVRDRPPNEEQLQACVVWRLAVDPAVPTLAAPEVDALAHGWKIVDLSAVRR